MRTEPPGRSNDGAQRDNTTISDSARARYPHILSPLRVGTLDLRHRVVVPPHGGGNGSVMGSQEEFENHAALWLAKVDGGMQWIGGSAHFVANPLPPGFEPTGVGSHGRGFYRDPKYSARIGDLAARVHAKGGYLSSQMVLQGGMPIGPSSTFSGYADHRIAHELSVSEVEWLVREYAESAAIAVEAGVDAIEIHANHDDVVQWFLSPTTNLRTDSYGGSFENRRRFLAEICEAIRDRTKKPFTFGLRLCLDEMIDGGYGIETTQQILEAFTADGTVDYFSMDIGSNWGSPSYIPTNWHGDAEWASLCGKAKQATSLPVIYTGRVFSLDAAERILAEGHADAVAMARATMADPDIFAKTMRDEQDQVRPCVGLNECIHRKMIEGVPAACGVNVKWARERVPDHMRTDHTKSVLVIGGGPAGTEFAALAAERSHRVQLWERGEALGGAFAIAALARGNHRYREWIDFQTKRLMRVGVEVQFNTTATIDAIRSIRADVIAVATGASPRAPRIPGIDLPHVRQGVDVLRDRAALRTASRVAVVVEDDGPAPLSIADHIAGLGHKVTFIHQTTGPAPLVGKYSNGAMLGRMIDDGVEFVSMTRVVGIGEHHLDLASTYGGRRWTLDHVDHVVLACGAIGNDSLYEALRVDPQITQSASVHILGDAFAPRRVVFATRQAWELAGLIG